MLDQNVGEPDFPFGYAHVRLVLKRGQETIIKHRFNVANDGGSPSPEQWTVGRKDGRVEVTISGEEQPEILYNVNLFLLDWDSSNYGHVCFNDLLSGMYRMEYGDDLYARDYPYSDDPFSHSMIPAELFESVILDHFDISIEEFHEKALYKAESDSYPWQDLYCGNVLYYPELIPEVTKATENSGGTVTLQVNVICPDKHTDHLFAHEVTLRIAPDETFRYLSNHIVYRSNKELPFPAGGRRSHQRRIFLCRLRSSENCRLRRHHRLLGQRAGRISCRMAGKKI